MRSIRSKFPSLSPVVRIVFIMVLLCVVLLALLVALVVIDEWRLERKLQDTRSFIRREIPLGSSVSFSMQILREHGVKDENMSYGGGELSAAYPDLCHLYECGIYMQLFYDKKELLERWKVEKAYLAP